MPRRNSGWVNSSYQRDLARAIGDAILSYRAQAGSGREVADD